MSALRYAVVTFGCRVNQADSLGVEAALVRAGAAPVSATEADVVLVNTCSVTGSADQGARQVIRRIHRENPSARIVVTGCFATRRPDEVASLDGVVEVVPNDRKPDLPSLLQRLTPVSADAARTFDSGTPGLPEGACGRTPGPGLMGRTAWTLRVQTGCEERCTYCIIPRTRGASRSRGLADVRRELVDVVQAGYREVNLTGVHLGSWGRDLTPTTGLAHLLGQLAVVPGDFRLRVSSLEPMDCTDGVLDVVAAHPARFAAHLHLPLQHADDGMLERMGRPYTAAQYATLVDEVRRRMPHAAIGSDVIVGFPGESDEAFERLAAYLEQSPLTHLHVFPYSDRPDTVAAAFPGKVHGSVVRARAQQVRAISQRLTARFRASQTGVIRPALTLADGRVAMTDNYIRVPLAEGHARNTWVQVRIPPPERSDAAQPSASASC